MALEITDASFEEVVLKSDKPVMVDFLGCMVRTLSHGRSYHR